MPNTTTPNRAASLLADARKLAAEYKEALRLSQERERAARAECEQLRARLHDLGEAEAPASRQGYGRCTPDVRQHMIDLAQSGISRSAIARRLGFSVATVSLICRGKYPGQKAQNPPPAV